MVLGFLVPFLLSSPVTFILGFAEAKLQKEGHAKEGPLCSAFPADYLGSSSGSSEWEDEVEEDG